jgi:hypothetical protein
MEEVMIVMPAGSQKADALARILKSLRGLPGRAAKRGARAGKGALWSFNPIPIMSCMEFMVVIV